MVKLTINTLAMGNIRQRKKQYTVLIIGIILAMLFSSGTVFFISCTITSNEEFIRRAVGDFYGYYFAPEEFIDMEQSKNDGLIEEYGYAHILGYIYTDNEKTDYGTPVAWLDETAKELYYACFEKGTFPEAKGEIAIEKDALLRLGIKAGVGDTVTLSMLNANGTEYFSEATDVTYKLVGILSDKRKNIIRNSMKDDVLHIPAAFVYEEEQVLPGGKEILSVYFNPTQKSLKEKVKVTTVAGELYSNRFSVNFINEIYENIRLNNGNTENSNRFDYNIKNSFYDRNDNVLNSSILSITLAVVLMIASCIGIINAFSSNLKDRKKQIGLLRAVGATKRQIINIFGREAFIISLISAPISVVISYFGVKLYAYIMGDDFIFMPDFTMLIITVSVSVACVMLASLIPLISASKISPMQTIRNIELSRKMNRKKIRTTDNFKVPSLLANRSMKLYRGRQVCVTAILIITIFVSSFGFAFLSDEFVNNTWDSYNVSDYAVRRNSYPNVSSYANYINIDKKINRNQIRDILDYPMISSVRGYQEAKIYIGVDEYDDYMNLLQLEGIDDLRYSRKSLNGVKDKAINAESINELFDLWFDGENERYFEIKNILGTEEEIFLTSIQAYDTALLESSAGKFEIIDGEINIDKLNSGEEIILVAYENAVFSVAWDEEGDINFYGIQDVDFLKENKNKYYGNAEFNYLADAELGFRVGDTINLISLYSDLTEIDWGKNNYLEENSLSSYQQEVKIGAIVKPFYLAESMYNHNDLGIITTTSAMENITGRMHDYELLGIDYEGEITDEADKEFREYLEAIFAGSNFSSNSGYLQDRESKQLAKILIISLLSIVILMFAICASIVNNALTAKIREGKREIGTLRAVGASVREITSAYVLQLFSMFIWGMSFGFGGYIVVHFVMKKWFSNIYYLSFMLWPSIIICLLLCVICSVNLYMKIKQEMKHSIVENIREL